MRPYSFNCCGSGDGTWMEVYFCGNRCRWIGSSVGMGVNGSETGWRQVGMDTKSVGTSVIYVRLQAFVTGMYICVCVQLATHMSVVRRLRAAALYPLAISVSRLPSVFNQS